MKNLEIATIFNKIADMLEIKGNNPFRIRAYRRAAYNVEALGRDISLLSKDDLMEIPGIGSDLAAKIGEYIMTGRIDAYEKMKLETPESLLDLLAIPGVGPKTLSLLHRERNVNNVDELERLAKGHRLSDLPGIKEKTEANILRGIDMLKRISSRHPLGKVLPVAEEIMEYLSAVSPVDRIKIAGSIRRWKETINDIDIISTSKKPEEVMKAFAHMPGVKEILMKGPTKSSAVTDAGLQVDIRVVDEDSYGSALLYFTGSKAHNIRLRELALKSGMRVNEYGIFREKDGEKLGGRHEEDVYRVLGLQFIPPELREDTGEVEAAAAGALPKLIEPADIRGDLHVHTNWSDGNEGLEDIIKTPMEKGYQYIAITDHSKGLGVAHGLAEDRIMEQRVMIASINRKLRGFRILAGVEVNIKSDGSLDLGEEILNNLDIVIASVHSGFKQSREQITRRLTAAMKNPYVSVICHPTGRLLGEREGYEVDMDEVLKVASETGTAVEINAYPLRLDLGEAYVRVAKSLKTPLVISTDAHNSGQFDNMAFGVSVARRGWLEKKDVLNTLDSRKLVARIKKRRRS